MNYGELIRLISIDIYKKIPEPNYDGGDVATTAISFPQKSIYNIYYFSCTSGYSYCDVIDITTGDTIDFGDLNIGRNFENLVTHEHNYVNTNIEILNSWFSNSSQLVSSYLRYDETLFLCDLRFLFSQI